MLHVSGFMLHDSDCMVTLRLSRVGKTKHATYRLVVMDRARDPWGRFIEVVAAFDPHKKQENLYNIKRDRIDYWLSKGAQPSDTVRNLFIDLGIMTGKKGKTIALSTTRKAKMEKAKAKAAEPKEAPAPAATPTPEVKA